MIVYFLIDFALNIYISDNKFVYMISFGSFVEYLSTIPLLFVHVGILNRHPLIDFTRAVRFLRLYKLDKILARHATESNRMLFRLLTTFLCNLLISAAALYLFESSSLADISTDSQRFVGDICDS